MIFGLRWQKVACIGWSHGVMVCERLELNKNCVHIYMYHISQAAISTTMFSEPLTPAPPSQTPFCHANIYVRPSSLWAVVHTVTTANWTEVLTLEFLFYN